MNTLAKNQKCVVMRHGINLWLDISLAEQVQAILTPEDPMAIIPKYIEVEGRTINTADCSGVYLPGDLEDATRRKNGAWQCQKGIWHDRGVKCECRDEEESRRVSDGLYERLTDSQKATWRDRGYIPNNKKDTS